MSTAQIIIVIAVILLLGLIVFPLLNRRQFDHMPMEHKVRILMKQAKGLIYFKNVSRGTHGTLYFVKNKRKIYAYPWVLSDGAMHCTRTTLYDAWDYPENSPPFTDDEREQAIKELESYNKKQRIQLIINDGTDNGREKLN